VGFDFVSLWESGAKEDSAWHFLGEGSILLYLATSAAFLNKMDGVYKCRLLIRSTSVCKE
jgi:hypothetical protein